MAKIRIGKIGKTLVPDVYINALEGLELDLVANKEHQYEVDANDTIKLLIKNNELETAKFYSKIAKDRVIGFPKKYCEEI